VSGGARAPVSLTAQLTWRLVVLMCAAIVAVAAVIGWQTFASVHEIDDTALQNQARMLARQLESRASAARSSPGEAFPPEQARLPDAIRDLFRESDGDSLYVVVDRAGRLVDTSSPHRAASILPLIGANGYFRVPPGPEHPSGMLGYGMGVGPWRIAVAQRRDEREALINAVFASFVYSTSWLLLPIGALAVFVAVATVRRNLRPLRETAAAAAAVGPAQPGMRLPSDDLPRELLPVVGAVNDALDRMEAALARQRVFVGDAAHALRTPLAVLGARIDLMPQHPSLASLRGDVARMKRLVTQMLQMARLDEQRPARTDAIRLRDVAVDAIEATAPLAFDAGKDLALVDHAPDAVVIGNRADLIVAASNLIENAILHTPQGSTVTVDIVPPATLRVRDCGPGVAADQRSAIFERFHRAPDARPGGAGLGLSIVAAIAAAHHARITVDDAPGGGAVFAIAFLARDG
jgi:signal transduction histidine kinase